MVKKIILAMIVVFSLEVKDTKSIDTLVLSGHVASVSHPLFRIIQTNALKDVAKHIKFVLWKFPDELRALTLYGKSDFIAVPTNVGVNLYNKDVDIKLLNVPICGILQIVSRDKNKKSLKDFKGLEIAIPFRGDMPNIVFQEIAKKEGLNPKKDFKIRYVSTPMDAMQLLILRRVDHALLTESAISMAIRKSHSFLISIIASDLYRSVDLQKEWKKVFKTEEKILT